MNFPRVAAIPVLLTALLAACTSVLSPSELQRLADAQARWAARGFPDYAFEMRQACFCPFELTQWARIEVVGGAVVQVVLLDSGTVIPPNQLAYFPTVEGVFNRIRSALHEDYLEDVQVEFDAALGYPTRVSFIAKPNIADGGSAYYLRNPGPVLRR